MTNFLICLIGFGLFAIPCLTLAVAFGDTWKEKLQNSQEKDAMKDIDAYLKNEEENIKEEIETVLRQMCAGRNYREWSEDMIDRLYEKIQVIIYTDLAGQEDEDVGRLTVTEDMVVTAMMMYMVEEI